VVLLALASAGCLVAPRPEAAEPPTPVSTAAPARPVGGSSIKVRVAVQGRPDQAPLELAYRRGYFDQLGIQIEQVQIDSGAQMIPSLATNQIEVGNGSPSASLFNAIIRGIAIPIVADYAHTGDAEDTTSSLVIRKDLYAEGARALRPGWRVATPGVGTSADITIHAALEKDGVDPGSITKLNLASADMISALASKNIEAGVLTEPLVTDTVQKGLASVLYTAGGLRPGTYLSVLQYSPQFAAEQPEVATRFMQGYLRGARDYYDAFHLKKDRAAAIDLLTRYLTLKDRAVWEVYGPEHVDLNGYVDPQQLQRQADFFGRQGLLDGPPPEMVRYVDPRFAEAAVHVLGRR
jgi:NitT/TauT family transport system substrate-binding protein